jgi:hypothetical protein
MRDSFSQSEMSETSLKSSRTRRGPRLLGSLLTLALLVLALAASAQVQPDEEEAEPDYERRMIDREEAVPEPEAPALDEDLYLPAPTVVPEMVDVTALDSETLSRVVLLLSGYEYFPSSEDLLAVTDDPVPYLLAIAYDVEGEYLPFHRHRAVAALAYYPSDFTHAHLVYLLESPDTPELTRHHVINALAMGWGEAALADLEPFLFDDDLQLRLTAVHALGTISTEASLQLLENVAEIERSEIVRERIQRMLRAPAASRLR